MSTQAKKKSRVAESSEQLGGKEAFDLEVVVADELEVDAAEKASNVREAEEPLQRYRTLGSDRNNEADLVL